MNKRTRENVARFIITRVIPDSFAFHERCWPAHMHDLKLVYYAKLADVYLMLTNATPRTVYDPSYVWCRMCDYYYITVATNFRCNMKFYKNHILLTTGAYGMRFHDLEIIARYDRSLLRSFGITVSDVLHVVDSCKAEVLV